MHILLAEILFWSALLAICHSYLFYPFAVIYLARNKKDNDNVFSFKELPDIDIIMAVHNEEKIIAAKIESVLNSNYPQSKITFYIGSDSSNDKTDQIIERYKETNKTIKFKIYKKRSGKVKILNELTALSNAPILILTDANAIFEKDALYNLIRNFKNPQIKVVGGRLKNLRSEKKGVAYQEHTYMEGEFYIKQAEGRLWGCTMGVYGAFFGIRREAFQKVPDNFLVDDFYISLKAIEKAGKAIMDSKAIAFENVPGDLNSEFRRKKRIATGNFQNLSVFYPILFSGKFGLTFSFISHKVLRWLGPIFLIVIFCSLLILFNINKFYTIVLIIMLLSLSMPIIDYFHRKNRIHMLILRFITHFYYMNAALLVGLLNYLKGVKSNVWEPTKR